MKSHALTNVNDALAANGGMGVQRLLRLRGVDPPESTEEPRSTRLSSASSLSGSRAVQPTNRKALSASRV